MTRRSSDLLPPGRPARSPSRVPSRRRLASARGLRACLAQLMDEALGHGFHLTALHIRVAMLELEEVLDAGHGGPADG